MSSPVGCGFAVLSMVGPVMSDLKHPKRVKQNSYRVSFCIYYGSWYPA